jgi:hypothetical protein
MPTPRKRRAKRSVPCVVNGPLVGSRIDHHRLQLARLFPLSRDPSRRTLGVTTHRPAWAAIKWPATPSAFTVRRFPRVILPADGKKCFGVADAIGMHRGTSLPPFRVRLRRY